MYVLYSVNMLYRYIVYEHEDEHLGVIVFNVNRKQLIGINANMTLTISIKLINSAYFVNIVNERPLC